MGITNNFRHQVTGSPQGHREAAGADVHWIVAQQASAQELEATENVLACHHHREQGRNEVFADFQFLSHCEHQHMETHPTTSGALIQALVVPLQKRNAGLREIHQVWLVLCQSYVRHAVA